MDRMRANAFTRNIATRRTAWSVPYGGSANAMSYCPGCSRSANFRASPRWTTARSPTRSVPMLALSAARAKRARARVQVEHARAADRALHDTEPRLAHAVRSGSHLQSRRSLEPPPLELARDDADHAPPLPPSPVRNAECGVRN